jgi:hypothetical protein
MRAFICGVAVTLLVLGVSAQTVNQRESISVGISLTLGITEDAAVKQLTEAGYHVRKLDLNGRLKERGFTSMWVVDDRGDSKYTTSLGVIFFTSGRLVSAMRELLPQDNSTDVEFGRQLYFAMRDLEAEGDVHCTIHTENSEVPDYAMKSANLICGKKTITISLQTSKGSNETVQLNEEMGTH